MGPMPTTDIVVRLTICEHLAPGVGLGSQFEPPEILRSAVSHGKAVLSFFTWRCDPVCRRLQNAILRSVSEGVPRFRE